MQIESRVAGIPCIIQTGRISISQGNHSPQAETPDEYYGHCDIEFDVLDRRGRPAPWLERKLTADITADIETQILEELKNDYSN